MGFDKPYFFWLLLLLPIAAMLWYWTWGYFRKFETTKQYQSFLYRSNVPTWRQRFLSVVLKLLVLSLVVLGLTQPFTHFQTAEKKYKNVRLFFLVDVSLSMAYGEDVLPNRLAAAKKEIAEAYNNLDGSYEASIIPFAGDANPYYCPLTYSRNAFLSHLREMSDDSAPSLGTDLTKVFQVFTSDVYKKDKLDLPGINIIILLSDGGKDDSSTIDRGKLFGAVRKIAAKNFKVYTVGIGNKEPTPLILRDSQGNFEDYIRSGLNGVGRVYYSELDEEILKQIASDGHGSYLRYGKHGELYPFIKDVIKANSVVDTEQQVVSKVPLESYCFIVAAGLFLATGLMSKRRSSGTKTHQSTTISS